MQRIIQDNATGVSPLHLVFYDTRLWYLPQLGGNGQRQSADRDSCQRYSVKCLLMGHSSVFHCTVKHRKLNKNRKVRESIKFFDKSDSHARRKRYKALYPIYLGMIIHTRETLSLCPLRENDGGSDWFFPPSSLGRTDLALSLSVTRAIIHFYTRTEQLFSFLIDGEALESNISE